MLQLGNALSALKHGFFHVGFMLCDRCIQNGECKYFKPKGDCTIEKKIYRKLVKELVDEFELESVADQILVERVAMYLVRIARAEAYEKYVGVSEKSALWGSYISRLDNTLRGLMNDLAVTRSKRMQLEKQDNLLVSIDELIKKFVKEKGEISRLQNRRTTSRRLILSSWKQEYKKIRLSVHKER
jgi:hypothetical protein